MLYFVHSNNISKYKTTNQNNDNKCNGKKTLIIKLDTLSSALSYTA